MLVVCDLPFWDISEYFKGNSLSKNTNSVMVYSPLCVFIYVVLKYVKFLTDFVCLINFLSFFLDYVCMHLFIYFPFLFPRWNMTLANFLVVLIRFYKIYLLACLLLFKYFLHLAIFGLKYESWQVLDRFHEITTFCLFVGLEACSWTGFVGFIHLGKDGVWFEAQPQLFWSENYYEGSFEVTEHEN